MNGTKVLAAAAFLALAACEKSHIPPIPEALPEAPPQVGRATLAWVGGPTAVIERAGLRVMTDPMLGPRGPHAFTLPRHPSTGQVDAPVWRYTDPAAVALAPLDAVILSHGHNDHFDAKAREMLPKDALFVAPPSAAALVRQAGFTNVKALDWGEETVIERGAGKLRVVAVPAHHAHEAALDAELGKGNGYVLVWSSEHERPYTAYWTGDSVVFDGQAEALARFGKLDLLLAHMGGVGMDGPALRTMDADEAVSLFQKLDPVEMVPIHHTTFGHYREPVEALIQRARAAGIAQRVGFVREGETMQLAP
jgi:L-ascorbate metabolism protein UlaG (beta-lactamase superfamily)